MKAALIPPKGYYGTARKSHYHLALAQINDPDYIGVYGMLSPEDNYVILDNGAAEGKAVTNDELIAKATVLAVDEVVAPDVMRQPEATIAAVDYFLKTQVLGRNLKVMAVVQGSNRDTALRCMDVLSTDSRIDAIGIPRHFLETFRDLNARLKILDELEGTDKEVHLLGTSPMWCSEIREIALRHPWVRGVDTSMPYNYTRAGVELTVDDYSQVARLPQYFDRERKLDEELLNQNINTYLEWARGTEGTVR